MFNYFTQFIQGQSNDFTFLVKFHQPFDGLKSTCPFPENDKTYEIMRVYPEQRQNYRLKDGWVYQDFSDGKNHFWLIFQLDETQHQGFHYFRQVIYNDVLNLLKSIVYPFERLDDDNPFSLN